MPGFLKYVWPFSGHQALKVKVDQIILWSRYVVETLGQFSLMENNYI